MKTTNEKQMQCICLACEKFLPLYYTLIISAHVYSIYYLRTVFDTPLLVHFCYLTNVGMYLDLVYYILRLIYLKEDNNSISTFLNSNFMTGYFKLSYVISFVVAVMFWGMLFLNPSGLYDQEFEMSQLVNFFLHGGNFLMNFVEHFYLHRKKDSASIGMTAYFLISCLYLLLLEGLYQHSAIVIYPIVGKLGIQGDVTMLLSGFVLLTVGGFIYKLMAKGVMMDSKEK